MEETQHQPVKIPVWSPDRQPVDEFELPPVIASQPPREHLLYEVVKMQLANRRAGTAATKTRGEVSGGGKKPWRQKGTGRARAGSIRSPLWVGGATVFGPQPRSYAYRLPRSARKTALRAALALKQRQGELFVVSEIVLPEPKTKCMAAFLSRLGLEKKILIVIPGENTTVERTARNLPGVKVLRSEGLNVYDLLLHRSILFTRDAIVRVSERLGA
ncbi:MAG: 50S ribosomal protein L4 [Thermodesulfobacteriota bacterium]